MGMTFDGDNEGQALSLESRGALCRRPINRSANPENRYQ